MKTLSLVVLVLLAASGAPPRSVQRHDVSIEQFQYRPAVIHAAVGDTIVWRNQDIVPHTARAKDGSWDTGHMGAKAQRVTVMRSRGEHEFTCLYHSNMKGKLVVR
ncbi:MAG TPA: cupredoxin domain-containing protein [Longimicrobiales bacterium]|nr:cupredoxin domain-containing protein [Longimicrobiales bacterium]